VSIPNFHPSRAWHGFRRRGSATLSDDDLRALLTSSLVDDTCSARPGEDEPPGADHVDEGALLDELWRDLERCADVHDEMTRLHSRGLDAVGRLGELARFGPLAEQARVRLGELALHTTELSAQAEQAADPSFWLRREQNYVRPLRNEPAAVDPDEGEHEHAAARARERYAWSIALSVVTALCAAVLLLVGHAFLAAVLFSARLVTDLAIGIPPLTPAGLRAGVSRDSLISFRTRYFGCLFGYLADVGLWAGVVMYLVSEHRTAWAFAGASVAIVSLFGSLADLAAGAIGHRTSRPPIERMARNGAVLAGLLLLALVPVGATGLPYGVVVMFAAGWSSALIEIWRASRSVFHTRTVELVLMSRRLDADCSLTGGAVHAPLPGTRG
jgi:hypothetical protein